MFVNILIVLVLHDSTRSVSHLSHVVPSVGLSQHLSVIFVIPGWIPKTAGEKDQENFQVN